jgi:hypothetical protein
MYTMESVGAVLAAGSGFFPGGDGFALLIVFTFLFILYFIDSRVPQWEEQQGKSSRACVLSE